MAEQVWRPEDGLIRYGGCIHCGACCDLSCLALRWVALKNIAEREEVKLGEGFSIRSICLDWHSDKTIGACTPQARHNFPSAPTDGRRCPGYWFTDSVGNKLECKQVESGKWITIKVK